MTIYDYFDALTNIGLDEPHSEEFEDAIDDQKTFNEEVLEEEVEDESNLSKELMEDSDLELAQGKK